MAIVSLVLRGVDAATPALKRVGASVNDLNGRLDIGGKLATAFQASMIAAGAAVVTGLVAGVKAAADFETAMASVIKTVGRAEVEAIGLDKELIKLTRTIPNSAAELAEIAAAGGQLGIAAKDLVEFTKLAAQVGIAFDMSADESGTAMAKLSNVFGVPIAEVGKLTDALNHMSDNGIANARDLVNVLVRAGGVTRSFGLDAVESGAVANAFLSLGVEPEIAATAIGAILPRLQNATLQTAQFKAGLERIGMSAEDMEKSVQTGALPALQDFLNRLQSLNDAERSKAIGQMFMDGGDARLLKILALDASLLANSYRLVASESEYAGSVAREFASRVSTTQAAFGFLKNAANEVLIAIGNQLLPLINSGLGRVTGVLHRLADFLNQNPIAEIPKKLGLDFSTLQGVIDGSIALLEHGARSIQPVLSDAMTRIGAAMPGVFSAIGAALPPLFKRLGVMVSNMLNNADWGAIGQGITGFLKASSTAFVNVFNSLVQTTRDVTRNVNWHAIGVAAGATGGKLVGMAAEALTRINWGEVVMALQSASVAVARLLAGAIGGFAIGVIPGLGRAALNVLTATAGTIGGAIKAGVTGMIDLVIDGVRSFMNAVRETVLGAIAILRNPGQFMRNVGNFAINAVAPVQPVAMRSPVISAPAAPAPASSPFAPLANTVGSRADGQLGNLLSAAMTETRRKPPGADLVVANTSETIIPAQSAIAIPAPVLPVQSAANPGPAARPMANIYLTVQAGAKDAKAIAREAVALIQQQFEAEVQGRLA